MRVFLSSGGGTYVLWYTLALSPHKHLNRFVCRCCSGEATFLGKKLLSPSGFGTQKQWLFTVCLSRFQVTEDGCERSCVCGYTFMGILT